MRNYRCLPFHGSDMGKLLQISLWALLFIPCLSYCGVTVTEWLMAEPNSERALLGHFSGSWSILVDQAWQNEMGYGGGGIWEQWLQMWQLTRKKRPHHNPQGPNTSYLLPPAGLHTLLNFYDHIHNASLRKTFRFKPQRSYQHIFQFPEWSK